MDSQLHLSSASFDFILIAWRKPMIYIYISLLYVLIVEGFLFLFFPNCGRKTQPPNQMSVSAVYI